MRQLPQLNNQGPNLIGLYQIAQQMKNDKTRLRLAEEGAKREERRLKLSEQNASEQHEINVLTIGKEYLKRVADKDDYQGYRDYMINKYKVNPDMLPESFDTEKAFNDWRNRTVYTAGELIKLKNGEKVTMSKVNDDGTISTVEAKNTQEAVQYGKQGFNIGKTTGTPRKTLADITAETKAREKVKAKYKETPEEKLQRSKDLAEYKESIKDKTPKSESELTRAALKGDESAKAIIQDMQNRKIEVARASGEAVINTRIGVVDVEGTARAILDGRETIENVKNTFGVPVQEAVRAEVLSKDPNFNFTKPRIKLAAVKSSLMQQQKMRGMMGSFVKNLNKQLNRVDVMMKDVISRVGVRALDLPIRELKTRFKGSGQENALKAYLIEISNEIGKLSTGSAASIRELSTDAQERWAKIHDPNLSFNELKKILDETEQMGNMRLESTDEEIKETLSQLDNIREGKKEPEQKTKKGSRFRILRVE